MRSISTRARSWRRKSIHAADEGDTTTITSTLDAAQRNLTSVGAPPSSDDPAECVADKGYHSRAVLTDLDGGPWKTRIAEPQRRGVSRWPATRTRAGRFTTTAPG